MERTRPFRAFFIPHWMRSKFNEYLLIVSINYREFVLRFRNLSPSVNWNRILMGLSFMLCGISNCGCGYWRLFLNVSLPFGQNIFYLFFSLKCTKWINFDQVNTLALSASREVPYYYYITNRQFSKIFHQNNILLHNSEITMTLAYTL